VVGLVKFGAPYTLALQPRSTLRPLSAVSAAELWSAGPQALREVREYLEDGELPDAMQASGVCGAESDADSAAASDDACSDDEDFASKGKTKAKAKSKAPTKKSCSKSSGGQGLSIIALGCIETLHPAFHSAAAIYPVGYHVRRGRGGRRGERGREQAQVNIVVDSFPHPLQVRRSMKSVACRNSLPQHDCLIEHSPGGPRFVVRLGDQLVADSADIGGAWRATHGSEGETDHTAHSRGLRMFALSSPAVVEKLLVRCLLPRSKWGTRSTQPDRLAHITRAGAARERAPAAAGGHAQGRAWAGRAMAAARAAAARAAGAAAQADGSTAVRERLRASHAPAPGHLPL